MTPARAFVAVLCILSAVSSAEAAGTFRTVEAEGLRINVDADWGSQLAPGYLPVRFDIQNLGDARTIDVLQRGTRFSYRMRSPARPTEAVTISIIRTVQLARGARVRFTMPVPVAVDNEAMQFEIREGNRQVATLTGHSVSSGVPFARAATLLVARHASEDELLLAGPATEYVTHVRDWSRTMTAPSGAIVRPPGIAFPPTAGGPAPPVPPAPPLDVVLEPERLPTNWLGYTSLRAVVIGSEEWRLLNDGQREALRLWVASGGDLILVDADASEWKTAASAAVAPRKDVIPYFFGAVHPRSAAHISDKGLLAVLAALPNGTDANWALPVDRAPEWSKVSRGGMRFPMSGIGEVHARAYLAILLLFALIIGPINYAVLQKRRQLALLVLTVPAISLAFVLLLLTYVVVGEGFKVHARAATLTLLDQTRQQAVTRASVSMYAAGRSPDALAFSSDTAVLPLGFEDAAQALDLRLTDGQHIDGLVRARTPVNFQTLSPRVARERLTFEGDGDSLEVVNGLGATVKFLILRRGEQLFQLRAPLGVGQRARLTRDASAVSLVEPLHPLASRFASITASQPDRSYIAVLEHSPFWQPGVDSLVEHDSVHVVLGLVGS